MKKVRSRLVVLAGVAYVWLSLGLGSLAAAQPAGPQSLACSMKIGLIREDDPSGYQKNEIVQDIQLGWRPVLSTVEVVAEMSATGDEAVLLFEDPDPSLAPCELELLKVLRGVDVGPLITGNHEGLARTTTLVAPCVAAGVVTLSEQLRARFPHSTWSCVESEGTARGVVYLGDVVEKIRCGGSGFSVRIVQMSSRSIEERCRELGRRLRASLEQSYPSRRLPAFVVLNGIGNLGYGKAFVSALTRNVVNTVCLPGGNYQDWAAAHEAGHLILQLEDHPASCSDNIMVDGNLRGIITKSQVSRACEQRVAECPGSCAELTRYKLGEDCLPFK